MSAVAIEGLCECGCGERTNVPTVTNPSNNWIKGVPQRFVHGHHWRGKKRGPQSAEHKAKMVASKNHPKNEEHPMWKGDEASYSALHYWVARNKERTGVCYLCGAEAGVDCDRTEFANISGEYRRDVEDYLELCRKCHKRFDGYGQPLTS